MYWSFGIKEAKQRKELGHQHLTVVEDEAEEEWKQFFLQLSVAFFKAIFKSIPFPTSDEGDDQDLDGSGGGQFIPHQMDQGQECVKEAFTQIVSTKDSP